MEDVAAGKSEPALEVVRAEHLGGDDGPGQVGRVRTEGPQHGIEGTSMVHRPGRRRVLGEG